MKTNIQRLQYYTRKCAQYSQKRRYDPHRVNRLLAFKTELNRRLEAERLRWKPAINI